MKKEEPDLDELKLFYEPHPGLAGAIVPIPNPVKRVADELDGKTLSLRDAVAKIKAVTNGEVDIDSNYKDIGLTVRYGSTKHTWSVIKYRDGEKIRSEQV